MVQGIDLVDDNIKWITLDQPTMDSFGGESTTSVVVPKKLTAQIKEESLKYPGTVTDQFILLPRKILFDTGLTSIVLYAVYKKPGFFRKPTKLIDSVALKILVDYIVPVREELKESSERKIRDDCRGTGDYLPDSSYCSNMIFQKCITPPGGIKRQTSKDILKYIPKAPKYATVRLLAMEKMQHDIRYLNNSKFFVTNGAKKKIVMTVYSTLMCLLSQDRFYTDLKPDNVLFTFSSATPKYTKNNIRVIRPKDLWRVKLGDLAGICTTKGGVNGTTYPQIEAWAAFANNDGFPALPLCIEDNIIWQMAIFTLEVYGGELFTNNIGRTLVHSAFPRNVYLDSNYIEKLLSDLRSYVAKDRIPNLPLENLRRVFVLNSTSQPILDETDLERPRLENLFKEDHV